MAVGFVFQGIAKSPRNSFTTLYIDDAVQKTKTGFYMGICFNHNGFDLNMIIIVFIINYEFHMQFLIILYIN